LDWFGSSAARGKPPEPPHPFLKEASMTSENPQTTTIVKEHTEYRLDEGDHERFSHYVPKAKLTEAMVMGTPVIALCGKVWVPSRNPDRFPVCPECKEIWASLQPGGGAES